MVIFESFGKTCFCLYTVIYVYRDNLLNFRNFFIYLINIIPRLGVINDVSVENMIQHGGDLEDNEAMQGASITGKEEDDIRSDNEPRQRHGRKDNIFHTR